MFKKLCYFLPFALFAISCKHEVVIPDKPSISFSSDVLPVIVGNCTESGCHGKANSKRFPLLTYDDVIKHGGISAGNANSSKLFQTLTARSFAKVMPPSPKTALSDQQIVTIYLWIMQGAKDN